MHDDIRDQRLLVGAHAVQLSWKTDRIAITPGPGASLHLATYELREGDGLYVRYAKLRASQ